MVRLFPLGVAERAFRTEVFGNVCRRPEALEPWKLPELLDLRFGLAL
jgi:hypothetical protein